MRLGSVCPCPRTHEDIAASMEVRQLAGRAANAEELQFQPLPRRRRREVAATGGEREQTTGGSPADDRSGGSFQHAVYLENARSVLGTSAVRQPAPVPPPRDPTAWVVEYATAAYAGAADLRTLRENAASASVHSLQERAVKQLWLLKELVADANKRSEDRFLRWEVGSERHLAAMNEASRCPPPTRKTWAPRGCGCFIFQLIPTRFESK